MANSSPSNLAEQVRSQLAEFPYRRLFVGYSGGLDSSVLLHVAATVEPRLTAVHVNHGLQPLAAAWEERCAAVCNRLDVAFESRRMAADRGEAGGRQARYAAFDTLLGADDLLLLAHHRDDQAETVLLRLVQGRAPLGMPHSRELPGRGRILRPWLATPRAELLRYAQAAELEWIDDPTNAQLTYDRNFLRHQIMPLLAERWPGAARALATAGQERSERDALLAHLAGTSPLIGDAAGAAAGEAALVLESGGAFESGPPSAGRARDDAESRQGTPGAVGIDLAAFPQELRVAILRTWLNDLGEYTVTKRALAEFVRQLDAKPDASPVSRLRYGELRRFGSIVVHVERQSPLLAKYRLDLPGRLALPHGDLTALRHTHGFHAVGPLEVRFRQGGERIRLRNTTRTLKKLFHARGIPPWQRPRWPLLYAGDALIAIPEVAVADSPDRDPKWHVTWHPRSS